MEFLRSILAQDETITVSTRVTYDLPVNPLSHIIFTLKFLNDTGTITNYTALSAALALLSNVSVEFKGSSILSMGGKDLAIYSALLTGLIPRQVNQSRTNNDVRSITVIIPFGRLLFNPDECFPAVKRGELRLIIDYAAAQTGIDTPIAQIETVELMGAAPTRFVKGTVISKTMTSGVGNDVDLPIGNPLLGVLLFGTTIPDGSAYDATIGKVKVLVDNQEMLYSEANWESLHGELRNRFPASLDYETHVHYYSGAEAGAATTLEPETDIALIKSYAYLDFDPLKDGSYALVTEGKSRIHLRVTAEASDAARIIPVELIQLAAGVGG